MHRCTMPPCCADEQFEALVKHQCSIYGTRRIDSAEDALQLFAVLKSVLC
jgi:hypothetical protein